MDARVEAHFVKVEQDLARLGMPLPFTLTAGSAEAARQHYTELFAQAHNAYAKTQKAWVRAMEDRDQTLNSDKASQAKKDAAVEKAAQARIPRAQDFHELLRARAGEELARCLPGLVQAANVNDEASLRWLLQWATGVDKWAWCYFG